MGRLLGVLVTAAGLHDFRCRKDGRCANLGDSYDLQLLLFLSHSSHVEHEEAVLHSAQVCTRRLAVFYFLRCLFLFIIYLLLPHTGQRVILEAIPNEPWTRRAPS